MSHYSGRIVKEFCPRGHRRTRANLTKAGGCCECKRIRERGRFSVNGKRIVPSIKNMCPYCGHSAGLHDSTDSWRCYHREGRAFDCECMQIPAADRLDSKRRAA